jgi:hypothetical protein
MLGDNMIVLNADAIKEALQEYLAKRFAEGHIPVVMGWQFKGAQYGPDTIEIKTRDPHLFLDIGTNPK